MVTRLSCKSDAAKCLCTNVDFCFNSILLNAKLIKPLFVNSGVAREAENSTQTNIHHLCYPSLHAGLHDDTRKPVL